MVHDRHAQGMTRPSIDEVLRNVCEDCGKRSDTERTMLGNCQVMLAMFLSRKPQMAPRLASGNISQLVKCVG